MWYLHHSKASVAMRITTNVLPMSLIPIKKLNIAVELDHGADAGLDDKVFMKELT